MDAETFKRFHRTQISHDDFEDVVLFIRAARNHFRESPEFEALLIAAIIAYARPFSGNERGRNPPVDSRLAAHLVPFVGIQRELHERIINARNQAVAHAEAIHYPVEQVPPSEPGTTYLTTTSSPWHVVKDLNPDLDAFEAIAKEMRQRCAIEQFNMAESSSESGRLDGEAT